MKWLLIVILVLGISFLLFIWTNQPTPTPPTTFQKPTEVQPELEEKIWLQAKLTKPMEAGKTYKFKIDSGQTSHQTEPFITKDIRLYKPDGERIINNRFLLPDNLAEPQKITLITPEEEVLAEADFNQNLTVVLKDKTDKTLFEISIFHEKGI